MNRTWFTKFLNQVHLDTLDDVLVFGLLTTFMAFSGVGFLKALALGLSVVYVFATKKFSLAPHWITLTLLISLNLILHIGSPYLDMIIDETLNRFALYLLVSGLVYLIYADPIKAKANSIKLGMMILFDLGLIFMMFIPMVWVNGRLVLARFGGDAIFGLVYVSSNLLAFYGFCAHVLIDWLSESKTKYLDFSTPWIKMLGHGIFFGFGVLTQSRGYYVYLGLWILIGIIRRILLKNPVKDALKLAKSLGLAVLILGSFVLILRWIPQFTDLINRWAVGVRPLSIEGRFISLIKFVFTDSPMIDASTLDRLNLFSSAWILFLRQPFIGIGLGAFSGYAVPLLNEGVFILNSSYSHVELMEMLSSVGLLGTLLYYYSYKDLLKVRQINMTLGIFLILSLGSGFVFRIFYEKLIWWNLMTLMALVILGGTHEKK
jgi:hypothetical protein